MEELEPSELGTQQYWENRYKKEITNFSRHGDPGEIWFGEDIVDRIIRWLNETEPISKDSSIVDVGCGNGMLLIELVNEGYTNLTGLDYSESAIQLAKNIAGKHNANIKYIKYNVLEGLGGIYDVVHDKGTYDAISLSDNAKENRRKYMESVCNCMTNNSFFIITSCNWTQSELQQQFDNIFLFIDTIPTPTFKFGGKIGSVVSICIFKKIYQC